MRVSRWGCNKFNGRARGEAKVQYLILWPEIQQRNRPGSFCHVLAYHLLAKQASDNASWMAVLASKKRGSDAVEKVHRVVGAPFLKVLLTKKVCSILSPFHHRAMRLPCTTITNPLTILPFPIII